LRCLQNYLTKSAATHQWLAGHPRDKVAFDCGISTGAVSNIAYEWKMTLGSHGAEELRELSVTLNKTGFRVATMLRRFGVDEDKFESFISDIHNRCCNELGLTPERIGFYIENLAELLDNIPVSEIPSYISHKVNKKKTLEQELEELQTRRSELERDTIAAMQNYTITREKLYWYSNIKQELEKYGISVDDISKFVAIKQRSKAIWL
jgi:hypothetical protein